MCAMPFSKSSADVKELLSTLNTGRIGEIITAVVGNDELQNRFEANPDFQADEFEGKPSGIIALDLGIVNRDVKNALLVAQASARMNEYAGEIDYMLVGDQPDDEDLEFIQTSAEGMAKFVGDERDPIALQKAQSAQLIAYQVLVDARQVSLHDNAKDGTPYEMQDGIPKDIVAFKEALDEIDTNAFRAEAAQGFEYAAVVLESNGFANEGVKLRALAERVSKTSDATPVSIANDLVKVYNTQSAEHTTVNNPSFLQKLIGLSTQDDVNTLDGQAPRKG